MTLGFLEGYFILVIISIILWVLLMIWIIRRATYAKEQKRLLITQTKLLVEIARKNGVEESVLEDIKTFFNGK